MSWKLIPVPRKATKCVRSEETSGPAEKWMAKSLNFTSIYQGPDCLFFILQDGKMTKMRPRCFSPSPLRAEVDGSWSGRQFLHFAVFLFEPARPLWRYQVRKLTEQLHASLTWIWSLYCSEADWCKHTSETTGRENRSFNQQWTCSLFPRRSFKSSINRVSDWTFSFLCFSPNLTVLSVPSWITDLSGKNQLNGNGNHTAARFTTQTLRDDYCCGIKCVFIILPECPTLNLWVFNDSSVAVFQTRGCSFFFSMIVATHLTAFWTA